MSKIIRQVWTNRSDSNPDKYYQTLQYTDESTSCDCKGWTRRTATDGSRSCKHTRDVDMGLANRNAVSTIRYDDGSGPAVAGPANTSVPMKKKKKTDQPSLFVNKRKFA